MFGFGKQNRRKAQAQTALTFHVEEVDKNIQALEAFDTETMAAIARDIYVTYRRIDLTKPPDKEATLQPMLEFALSKRHEALSSGASSREDPLWNVSSLIESITTAELLNYRGLDNANAAYEIRQKIATSILNTHISDEEKAAIDEALTSGF